MDENALIDKLAWILTEEGKVLCVRSKNKNAFYFPGGKREPGETDAEALLREIREELSVELVPQSLAFAGTFASQAHGKPPGMDVRLTCYTAEYRGALTPEAEIEEMAWLSYSDRARCSLAAQIVFDWLKEKDMIAG